jgi:hypothetical protein
MTTTDHGHSSSRTNTWEWSSTPLLNASGNDSGHRLDVGHADNGGAANVVRGHRSVRYVDRAARLAVVLKRKRD